MFGQRVAIEGARVLIGAGRADGRVQDEGAVYLFARETGAWTQTRVLRAAEGAIGDNFGASLDLSGADAVIGGGFFDTGPRRAYVFDLEGPDCDGDAWCDEGDCNGNGVADTCDLVAGPYVADSGSLSPIGWATPQQFAALGVPHPAGPVALSFEAHADINSHLEYFNVVLNGSPIGSVFVNGFADCSTPPDTDQITLTDSAFESLIGVDRVAVIDVIPTTGVSSLACQGESFVRVRVAFEGSASTDEDGDSRLDECEAECPADVDFDGAVGFTDLAQLLNAWGRADPESDVDRDGLVDLADLLLLLLAWGPCN